jgi:TolB-like protein
MSHSRLTVAAAIALGLTAVSASAAPVIQNDATIMNNRQGNITRQTTVYEPVVIQHSLSPSGQFNAGMMFLTEQLERNALADSRSRATVITSFVDLNNLNETSQLGRLIGEHFMHQLQIRGWNVTDVRMTRDLVINEEGEFSLSRELKRLRGSLAAGNIVTGTYTTTVDGVLLSVRVLDIASGQVVSTAQTRFLRDKFIASLVEKPKAVPVISLTR